MASQDDRFVRIYKQGGIFDAGFQIWADKITGVNYLVIPSGYGSALTPLLNRDGTPVVSPLPLQAEE